MSKQSEIEDYQHLTNIDIKQTMLSGTAWRSIGTFFRAGWNSIVVLLLAFWLGPTAFGLVGMTDALVQFFNIFMGMGFDSAVIQQERINNTILSSLFWLNIVSGVILTSLGILISPLIAWFYNESLVQPIFAISAFTFILQSLSIVQQGLLSRQLQFRSLAIIEIVSSFLASVIGIIVAFLGGSFWSLVILQLSRHVLAAIGYWFASSWRPQFVFDLKTSLDSVKFSGNIILSNIAYFASTRLDIILVGKLLGAEDLGFYLLASQLVFRPLDYITITVVNRTLYPVLSSVQHSIEKVRKVFNSAVRALFSVISPVLVFVAIIAPTIVPFQMGEEWFPLIPLIIIWSLGGIRRLLTQQEGVLFLAMNRPDMRWKFLLFSIPITTLSLFIGVSQGSTGVSISYNLAQFAVSFVAMYYAFSLVDMSIGTYFKQYQIIIAALVLQAIFGIFLVEWLESLLMHPYLLTILSGIITCGLYATVVYLFDAPSRDLWIHLKSWIYKFVMKRKVAH